jgi:hypothetical protein
MSQHSNEKFRKLEDLTDSEEEIHPNIDTKSFRKFVKKEREIRLEELKSKPDLNENEKKELEKLIYKSLPVLNDISEDNFRTCTATEPEDADYSEDLSNLINLKNFTIDYFVEYLDQKSINLTTFENLIDINSIECIKTGNDEVGEILCKISLCTKWAREFGKQYLLKLGQNEFAVNNMVKEQYRITKEAILNLHK